MSISNNKKFNADYFGRRLLAGCSQKRRIFYFKYILIQEFSDQALIHLLLRDLQHFLCRTLYHKKKHKKHFLAFCFRYIEVTQIISIEFN